MNTSGPPSPVVRPPVAVGRPVRAVLVGCGAMSATWLWAAAELGDVQLVGLVDLNEEAARGRQAEFGLPNAQVGTDLDAVLSHTRPDLVFDCTVPEAHHATALGAFRHGAGVVAEKPLADTLEGAQELVQAAREAGLLHAVIQNRRFDPNIRRVRAALEGGTIGPLTGAHADFFIGAHFGGFREAMRHPLLLDMAVHTFDAARLLTGQDAVGVYCHAWNPAGSWYAHGASAVAVFELSGGAVFSYRGSWCAQGFPTGWEADWRLTGTRGSVRWDGGAHPRAALARPGEGFLRELDGFELPPADPAAPVGGHLVLLRGVLAALRAGTRPETDSADNIRSLAMVFAAIQSAERGERVPVVWE